MYDHDNKIIMECRDVYFLENPMANPRDRPRMVDFYEISKDKDVQASGGSDVVDVGNLTPGQGPLDEEQPEICRPVRIRKHPSYLDDYCSLVETVEDLDPVSYSQAINGHDAVNWMNAMREEIESIHKNQVWQLVDLPKDRKAIGCKWVLKKKFNSDGSLDKYKARLVAKGFTQVEGIDYDETFSPVVKFQSIRTLMAVVAYHDLELHQMDVKTAFLNG